MTISAISIGVLIGFVVGIVFADQRTIRHYRRDPVWVIAWLEKWSRIV